jgi:glycosyltransferase involved in cell wall biosynthesis
MKIIYLLPHLGKGGAEELVYNLSNNMSNMHDVTLYLLYKTTESKNKLDRLNAKISVKYLINYELKFLSKARLMLLIMNYLTAPIVCLYIFLREKFWTYDIIHINLTQPSFYMIFFKIMSIIINSKSVYVQTFHTNYHLLKGVPKYINICSWYFNDVFIYELYESDAFNFERFMPRSKINYFPFGYCDNQTPIKNYSLISEFTDKDVSLVKIFMTISRVRFSEKKIDIMLRAMYEYKKINRNFLFIIGGDGEDMIAAKRMSSDLKLDDNVIFLGFVDNVSELSVLADVYLVSIVGEHSGVSGMQAISNNIPLVGVQTLEGVKMSDGLMFGDTPKEISVLLLTLDNKERMSEYLITMSKISAVNCNNEKNFTKLHESLYRSLVE